MKRVSEVRNEYDIHLHYIYSLVLALLPLPFIDRIRGMIWLEFVTPFSHLRWF